MKPLRSGLAAGLLAGGVAAANKLIAEWREGPAGTPRVVTGADARSQVKGGAVAGVSAAVNAVVARRAARRAEANRPPWVVAPLPPGATAVAPAPAPARPAVAAARKLPSLGLDQLKPPSAKAVGATVGKYAAKQAGKALGKATAERVGKAIEVIETLEKVMATASEPVAKPDMTPSGPGAAIGAVVETAAPPPAAPRPKPQGTLVSVRKRERGPRVVVGPGVAPPPVPAMEPDPEATVESPAPAPPPAKKKAAPRKRAAPKAPAP